MVLKSKRFFIVQIKKKKTVKLLIIINYIYDCLKFFFIILILYYIFKINKDGSKSSKHCEMLYQFLIFNYLPPYLLFDLPLSNHQPTSKVFFTYYWNLFFKKASLTCHPLLYIIFNFRGMYRLKNVQHPLSGVCPRSFPPISLLWNKT